MRSKALRLALLLLVLAGIALAVVYRGQVDVAVLQRWVAEAGAAGPLLFILAYAIGTVFFLPGSILTLAGGAIFGPVLGTFCNLTGGTLGATLAFLVARYLAATWVERKTGGRLKRLKEGVEGEGWRFVAFVRLVPLFPFNFLNYALGLTRIKLSHYVIASYLCMLPGAIAYTYLGYAGREAVAGGQGLIQKGLLALALLATVAFLPRLVARLRQRPMLSVRELKQRLESGEDLMVLDVRPLDGFTGELGHITGATHIPLDELGRRLHELEDYQEKPVVAICRTDRMSGRAARLLVQKGFVDVHVIKGGMVDWNQNGFPVCRGRCPMAMAG